VDSTPPKLGKVGFAILLPNDCSPFGANRDKVFMAVSLLCRCSTFSQRLHSMAFTHAGRRVGGDLLAAWPWTQIGPTATFALGAWMGAIALGLLVAWWPWLKPNGVPWPQDPENIERQQESRFE
jgi:hypothetical protein